MKAGSARTCATSGGGMVRGCAKVQQRRMATSHQTSCIPGTVAAHNANNWSPTHWMGCISVCQGNAHCLLTSGAVKHAVLVLLELEVARSAVGAQRGPRLMSLRADPERLAVDRRGTLPVCVQVGQGSTSVDIVSIPRCSCKQRSRGKDV